MEEQEQTQEQVSKTAEQANNAAIAAITVNSQINSIIQLLSFVDISTLTLIIEKTPVEMQGEPNYLILKTTKEFYNNVVGITQGAVKADVADEQEPTNIVQTGVQEDANDTNS